VRAATRALVLGIGGGGDVVGALAAVRRCEELGTEARLGGVAWERLPIDPRPGPRSVDEISGGRRVGSRAVLADGDTTTIDGIAFSESHVARHLDTETILIDITAGAVGAAEGIRAAATELGCDLIVLLDIGGDAIAAGDEAGLASPLCDSIMLAAGLRLAGELPHEFAVLGAGCDGELEPEEVLARVAALTGTEASMQVVRCARGETGLAEIRGGRRTVTMSPLAAIAFCFNAEAAAAELPMARTVLESTSLDEADDALTATGVRTELSYERRRAAELS
jgi:hypothetical protein